MEKTYAVVYDGKAIKLFNREIDAKGYMLKVQAEKKRFLDNVEARYKAQTTHCDSYWWVDSIGEKHLAYLSSMSHASNEQLAKWVEESRVIYEKSMEMRVAEVKQNV